MSDPVDPATLGPFHSPSGGISALRVGFFVCLGAAVLLAGAQVALYIIGKPGDLTGIIGTFLVGAFGGKVGQAFAEKES